MSYQGVGQIDRRLSPELHDHAQRSFQFDDMHHVLGRQRFEVQLVADREIRRHRFRVVVDDDGLIARMAQRFYAVHRRIVELHALSDTDRSRSEHDDLLDMVQKEWIHARDLLDRFRTVAVAQPLGDHEDPLVVALLHLVFQFFPVHLGDRSLVQVVDLISKERIPFKKDSSKVRPMDMTSPVAFICVPR